MSGRGRIAVILITSTLFLLNAACTTIKPIEAGEEPGYSEQIEVGERIRLTLLDGRVKDIRVTAINATEVSGTLVKATATQRKGALIVADWRDVYVAERVKISALKTAGAAVGVVIAIPILAVGAVLACGAGTCQ